MEDKVSVKDVYNFNILLIRACLKHSLNSYQLKISDQNASIWHIGCSLLEILAEFGSIAEKYFV
jgi:hypothetical protein